MISGITPQISSAGNSALPPILTQFVGKIPKSPRLFKNPDQYDTCPDDPQLPPPLSSFSSPETARSFSGFKSINILDIYGNLPPVSMLADLEDSKNNEAFTKKYKIRFSYAEAFKYAKKNSKIFENISASSLPKGHSYNFVIKQNGDVIFGQVDNTWEIGVKHASLAGLDQVVSAGELNIPAHGKIRFNLTSGTYMVHLKKTIAESDGRDLAEFYEATLKAKTLEFFKTHLQPQDQVEFGGLSKPSPPNFAYALKLCKTGIILDHSNHSVCKEIKSDYEKWLKGEDHPYLPL